MRVRSGDLGIVALIAIVAWCWVSLVLWGRR